MPEEHVQALFEEADLVSCLLPTAYSLLPSAYSLHAGACCLHAAATCCLRQVNDLCAQDNSGTIDQCA